MTATAPAKPARKPKAKTIYEWTCRDHSKDCPRHPEFDEEQLAEMVRTHLRLDEKSKLPAREKWPIMLCVEEEGVCCPADIIVNASQRTIIIGATGVEEVARDQARVDPGDRRQGDYYVRQINVQAALGLQRVRDLPIRRLAQLEKERQIRTGDRPADWILVARERAKRGEGPPIFDDKNTALSALQSAAGDQYLNAFGDDIFGKRS